MLFLQKEKAAKPEKDDRYNDVLYHPGREITNATLRGFGRPFNLHRVVLRSSPLVSR